MASLFDLAKTYLSTTNLSYYSVPAAILLAYIPHAYANVAGVRLYDNANPRKFVETVANAEGLDKVKRERILRAKGAHNNGLETLGLYAAAVVGANAAGVTTWSLNLLTLGYLTSRAVYNYVYVVGQENRRLASWRSRSWFAGVVLMVTLFVKAGNAVKRAGEAVA